MRPEQGIGDALPVLQLERQFTRAVAALAHGHALDRIEGQVQRDGMAMPMRITTRRSVRA